MNRNYVLIAACGLAAGAGVLAWQLARANDELDAAIAAARERRTTAEARQPALRAEREAADHARAAVAAQLAVKAPPHPAPVPSPAELLQKDPKVQVLWLAARRATNAATYGPFFRALGLTDEQVRRFQDIALKREEDELDLSAIAKTQQLAASDPSIAGMREQADAQFAAARRELLGPDGYGKLQDFERTLPMRDLVGGIAGTAALAGIPLTPAQADAMTQALANANLSYRTGATASPTRVDWAAADRAVQAILTPAQFTLYQSVEPEGGMGRRFGGIMSDAIEKAEKADAVAAGH